MYNEVLRRNLIFESRLQPAGIEHKIEPVVTPICYNSLFHVIERLIRMLVVVDCSLIFNACNKISK